MYSPRDFKPITLISRSGERVLFRSTLEARWSVYFDLLAFDWEYEPFRFDIGGGITYTPDFSVQGMGLIEVKPSRKALDESLARIEKFVSKTQNRVYAVCASEVAPSVFILAESPIKIVECDRMMSKIILAGEQRRQDFKDEPYLSSIGIEQAIKNANNTKLSRGERKTPEERQLAAKWKRDPYYCG